MANAYFGKAGGATSFPATQAIIFEKQFRKRFRDQSIIPLITNSEWKGKFKGTGTEIKIPVLPVMHTYKTVPGDSYRYQEPKATEETFVINRERAWGIHFISEDQMFAQFNITSPILEEQAKVNGEDIEFEMLSDITSKCAPANTGDVTGKAGYVSGRYAIGSAVLPTTLFKTDALAGSGTAVTSTANKLSAPEFFVQLAATLNEQPGGKVGSWRVVVPTAVAALLQTSELKQADLTGDTVSLLRKSVSAIGNLAGMDIIQSDKIPVETVSGANCYPIIALDTTAITFAEEVKIEEKLKDIDKDGDFYRCKTIYDWFVRYPERFAVGYVQIGA